MKSLVSSWFAGSRRLEPYLGVTSAPCVALLLLTGCGAATDDSQEGEGEASVAREALTNAGSGWVRTPHVRGPTSYTDLSCMNCQGNSDLTKRNRWRSVGTGIYNLRFPGLAPASGTKVLVQTSAIGERGVVCQATGTAPNGDDYDVTVICKKQNTNVESRFLVTMLLKTSTETGPDRGFARVISNAIRNDFSWTSDGQLPSLTRSSTGVYSVKFPGLKNVSSAGHAQVSSLTSGVTCSLTQSGTTGSAGTEVKVACKNSSNAAADANMYVSYTQHPGWAGTNGAHVWAHNPTAASYTPIALYNQSFSPSSPFTVSRAGTGEYTVRFGTTTSTNLIPLLSTWGTSAVCTMTDVDQHGVKVSCSSGGTPVDAQFSLSVGSGPPRWTSGMKQVPVNGTNFKASSFDAGNGLICGAGATPAAQNQVLCVTPVSVATPSDARLACGGAVTGGIKSIAIDNVYAGPTRILVLGTDNVLRTCSGDLRNAWASGSNFTSWAEVAPALNDSGTSVTLKKIVAVRTAGYAGTDVFGLTTAGAVLMLKTTAQGQRWGAPVNFALPTATIRDISHGTYDLFMLTTSNIMAFSRRSVGYGGIPALPNGLLPIAMGGPFVITNAGLTSGKYPCTSPADASGNYPCAGNDDRFYRFMSDRTWQIVNHPAFPTENDDIVLTSGQPFASITPTIVDAEVFEGNANAYVAWQYFSRLYQTID